MTVKFMLTTTGVASRGIIAASAFRASLNPTMTTIKGKPGHI